MKNQEQDMNAIFEKLGGKQLLQEKYPAVYEGLLKGQQRNGETNDDFVAACPGIVMNIPEEQRSADGTAEEKWYLMSSVLGKFPEGMTYACITGELRDDSGIVYDSFAVEYDEGDSPVTDTEDKLQAYFPDIAQMNDIVYSSHGECYVSDSDGNVYHYTADDKQGILVEGGQSIVEEFTITAPRYRTEKKDGDIIVLYAREPRDSEVNTWDYDFPKNSAKNNSVKTMLNFSGTIKLKEGYQILSYIVAGNTLKLYYEGINEPNAVYNSPTGSFSQYFTISKDKRTCVFDFGYGDPDWHCDLDLSAYSVSCIQKLYGIFHLQILNKNQTRNIVAFVVSSTGRPDPPYFTNEGTYVNLPNISIRWGCFHKDTLIKMADGNEKHIRDIATGDTVLSGDGQPQRVTQIYTGQEENLVCLETEDGKQLLVTEGHPVRTADGIVRARDIRAGTKLVTYGGGRSAVRFAYITPYNDTVYNLELEESKELISEGILTGDFTMQNSMSAAKRKRPISEKAAETARQLKLLMRELGTVKD